MNIAFTYHDSSSYSQRNSAFWNLTMRRSYRSIGVIFLVGSAVLILGLFQPYSFSSDLGKGTYYYNFHFSIGLGGGLILVSLIYFYHLRVNKMYFDSAVKARIRRFEKSSDRESEVSITSESIRYSGFEEVHEIKWSTFSSYRIYKGFIALYQQENMPSYLVELNKLSPAEQTELMTFLKKKLRHRR